MMNVVAIGTVRSSQVDGLNNSMIVPSAAVINE